MLAGAGIDRQHEHEPGRAPGPLGRRGGCDRELHADADRRVHACQPAISRATGTAAVVAFRIERLMSASIIVRPALVSLPGFGTKFGYTASAERVKSGKDR